MKKILSILILIVVASSCSSSSDSKTVDNNVVGKWTEEKDTSYKNDGTVVTENFASDDECYHMTTYEYKADNSFVKISYDFVTNDCVQNPVRTGTWSASTSSLSVTVNGSTDSTEIISVSSTKLVLKKVQSSPIYDYKIIEYSKVN